MPDDPGRVLRLINGATTGFWTAHAFQTLPPKRFRLIPSSTSKTSKIAGGGSAPFNLCGDIEFVEWEGEKPITVRWQLPEAVSEKLRQELAPTVDPL